MIVWVRPRLLSGWRDWARRLERKVESIMSTAEELRVSLERIGTAVTDVAGDVRSLHERITGLEAGQPVSQETLDELNASASGLAERLESVAQETQTESTPESIPDGSGGDLADSPVLDEGEQPDPPFPPSEDVPAPAAEPVDEDDSGVV